MARPHPRRKGSPRRRRIRNPTPTGCPTFAKRPWEYSPRQLRSKNLKPSPSPPPPIRRRRDPRETKPAPPTFPPSSTSTPVPTSPSATSPSRPSPFPTTPPTPAASSSHPVPSRPHGIATDLGYMPPNVKSALQRVDVLLLESNHDLEMLKDGLTPGRSSSASSPASATSPTTPTAEFPPTTTTAAQPTSSSAISPSRTTLPSSPCSPPNRPSRAVCPCWVTGSCSPNSPRRSPPSAFSLIPSLCDGGHSADIPFASNMLHIRFTMQLFRAPPLKSSRMVSKPMVKSFPRNSASHSAFQCTDPLIGGILAGCDMTFRASRRHAHRLHQHLSECATAATASIWRAPSTCCSSPSPRFPSLPSSWQRRSCTALRPSPTSHQPPWPSAEYPHYRLPRSGRHRRHRGLHPALPPGRRLHAIPAWSRMPSPSASRRTSANES